MPVVREHAGIHRRPAAVSAVRQDVGVRSGRGSVRGTGGLARAELVGRRNAEGTSSMPGNAYTKFGSSLYLVVRPWAEPGNQSAGSYRRFRHNRSGVHVRAYGEKHLKSLFPRGWVPRGAGVWGWWNPPGDASCPISQFSSVSASRRSEGICVDAMRSASSWRSAVVIGTLAVSSAAIRFSMSSPHTAALMSSSTSLYTEELRRPSPPRAEAIQATPMLSERTWRRGPAYGNRHSLILR